MGSQQNLVTQTVAILIFWQPKSKFCEQTWVRMVAVASDGARQRQRFGRVRRSDGTGGCFLKSVNPELEIVFELKI